MFVNAVKNYQFKAKGSEMNTHPSFLGNISKYFSVNTVKKPELYGYMYDFSVDSDSIDIDDVLDIHK